MPDAVWPRYEPPSFPRLIVLTQFVRQPEVVRAAVAVPVLVALYLAGTRIGIPTLTAGGPAATVEWWFVEFLDEFFTGGAFGRGALLCLGVFGIAAVGKISLLEVTSRPREPRRLLRRGVAMLGVATVAAAIFVARGALPLSARAIGFSLAWIMSGALVLALINHGLVRWAGIEILHVNLVLVLVNHGVDVVRESWRSEFADPYLALGAVVLMAVSARRMLKGRVYLPVENIKSDRTRRTATLQLPATDRHLIDTIGLASLLLFLSLGGLLALLTGWRTLTGSNFLAFAGVSAAVMALVWPLVPTVRRVLGVNDPRTCALRLVRTFWIVPGVSAGAATESFIGLRIDRGVRQSLVTIVAWLAGVTLIQYYAFTRGSGRLLFPYGPVVFCVLFLMVMGAAGDIAHRIRVRFNRVKLLTRGLARVAIQTYPLPAPDGTEALDLALPGAEAGDERLSQRVLAMLEWYRFMKTMELQQARGAAPSPGRLGHALYQTGVALVSGLVLAFLGGGLYVLVVPAGAAIWEIVIPLFVGGILSPTAVTAWLARRPTR